MNALTSSSWSPVLAQAPPTVSAATFTYGYNGANQRTSQAASDNSYWSYPAATASTVSYTANNLDQYTAIGAVTPAYDGNGNLTSDGTFTYGYDAESRLISASGAGNSASYAYDAQGRRKSKTLNGTTTIFAQDPQGRALLDYAGSGGAVTNWYAFGPGPNDVLNQVNGAGTTRVTYVPDIQGSVIASLDASSGTLSKAGYQPYGESGGTAGTFRYTGARIDAETGLYDFRGRMYSPRLGRFPQTDPIGSAGGINLYAYVRNDPLNTIDPYGLCDSPLGCAAAFGQGLVAGFNAGALGNDTQAFNILFQGGNSAAEIGTVIGLLGGNMANSAADAVANVATFAALEAAAGRVAVTSPAEQILANVAPRALTEADLGLSGGSLQQLQGTFSVTNGAATAQIDMIQGTIKNPFGVIDSLSATAQANGAQTLNIQGTIANERLYNILSGRYRLTSQGAVDTITVPLRAGGR